MILDPTAYAFIVNMRPQEFERSLKSAYASKWFKDLGLFPNANTTSGNIEQSSEKTGRPRLDETEISESGEMNRDV